MSQFEYPPGVKGSLMWAFDERDRLIGTPVGASQFTDGYRFGAIDAVRYVFESATASGHPDDWIDFIIAMDPAGPCGWQSAIDRLAAIERDRAKENR